MTQLTRVPQLTARRKQLYGDAFTPWLYAGLINIFGPEKNCSCWPRRLSLPPTKWIDPREVSDSRLAGDKGRIRLGIEVKSRANDISCPPLHCSSWQSAVHIDNPEVSIDAFWSIECACASSSTRYVDVFHTIQAQSCSSWGKIASGTLPLSSRNEDSNVSWLGRPSFCLTLLSFW